MRRCLVGQDDFLSHHFDTPISAIYQYVPLYLLTLYLFTQPVICLRAENFPISFGFNYSYLYVSKLYINKNDALNPYINIHIVLYKCMDTTLYFVNHTRIRQTQYFKLRYPYIKKN